MIIDPKLQAMFERCREQKREIDRRKKAFCSVIFFPPLIIAAYSLIRLVTSVLSGFTGAITGTGVGSASVGPLTIIVSIALTLYTAGETILEEKKLMDISGWFYPAAAGLCIILMFMFPGESVNMLIFTLYCLIAIPLNIAFKKACADDDLMKPLKGYPHFNIMFMSDKDLIDKEAPDYKKQVEGMTDDERLMFERDHNM